jgi:probable rRNA maturation factor
MMKALVVNDTPAKISEKALQQQVKNISQLLAQRNILSPELNQKEVTLVFLDKLAAKKLNWQYRQKDKPTDVLSFESVDPESVGELVFCPDVLEVQAKEHNQTFEQELGLMLIHGILHLLGFDHETGPEDEAKMMGIQNEIFAEIFTAKKAAPKKAAAKSSAKAKPSKKAPARKSRGG